MQELGFYLLIILKFKITFLFLTEQNYFGEMSLQETIVIAQNKTVNRNGPLCRNGTSVGVTIIMFLQGKLQV